VITDSARICAKLTATQRTGYSVLSGDRVHAIYRGQPHRFLFARRPVNLCRTGIHSICQAEVNPQVVGGEAAAAAQHASALANAARSEINRRSNRIARAFGTPDQFQLDPVVVVWIYIAQQHPNAGHVV
jgi:hypothetical protein